MNKKLWIGVALLFVAGIFYSNLVGVTILQFNGGLITDDNGDFIVAPQSYYYNTLYYMIYSIPFIVVGIYLVKNSQKK